MTATKDLGVALCKCFYCLDAGEIVMNMRLTPRLAKQVEEMDGKVINLHPCSKCRGLMDQGIIVITVRDNEYDAIEADRLRYQRETESQPRYAGSRQPAPFIPNPYRSGVFTVMSEDGFRRISDALGFSDAVLQQVLRCRWTFMEDAVAELAGLYQYLEENGDEVPYRQELRKAGKDPHAEAVANMKRNRK